MKICQRNGEMLGRFPWKKPPPRETKFLGMKIPDILKISDDSKKSREKKFDTVDDAYKTFYIFSRPSFYTHCPQKWYMYILRHGRWVF